MALQGQLNQLADQIKTVLEDGIESTGVICTDGTPAYAGTGTGEDFAGFSIYALDIDDEQEASEILDLPMIRFWTESSPVEYFLSNAAFYLADITFEIYITEHHSKTINGTAHTRKTLINWYLERLEYVLLIMELTVVNEAAQRNPFSMSHGRVAVEDEFLYMGTTKLEVEYEREVS
jgi:hypothetical protein